MHNDSGKDLDLFAGGGEMTRLMRSHDWQGGTLGAPETWPDTLRLVLALALDSQLPMAVWWGPELIQLYNDSHRLILGAIKHPDALGSPARLTWPEIWDTIGPLVDQVMIEGRPVKGEDMALTLHRNGFDEECFFTFSYSAIRDSSRAIVGMFIAAVETTARVHSERRLATVNQALEQQVHDRTRDYDRIWRMSQDILAVASFNGYFLDVNPAFGDVLGWDQQEAVSIPFMELVHPSQREELAAMLAKLAEGGAIRHFEVQSRHKDGSYRWLSWTIRAEHGLLYGVGRDVTLEKRQALQILETSEARLRLAMNAGGMGAWEWDFATNQALWWPGMWKVHGLDGGEMPRIMTDYQNVVHPDDRDRVRQILKQALEKKSDQRLEYRAVWPDGSTHWIEGHGKVMVDDTGAPLMMAGICVDITARKQVEQDLRFLAQASAALAGLTEYQTTLNRIAELAVPEFADWCAVDMLDEAGQLQRVAVAHVDPQKVELAHELHRRYPPDRKDTTGTWNVLRTGVSEHVSEIPDAMLTASIGDTEQLTAIRALGLRSYIGVPLMARGKPSGVITFIAAESGRTYGAGDLALAEDLARRASIAIDNLNLYRELREADHRKDVFLATLAHELRNPLAPISNALSVIDMAGMNQQSIDRANQIIRRQVRHVTRLVDDLMDVSRITTGKIELRKEPTSLAQILRSAVETSRPHMQAAGHELLVSLPDGATDLSADPIRLEQVFANLLNNAAKYTDHGGRIELRLDLTAAEFVVSIKDNGVGIASAMLDKIFTIFTQVTHPLERSQGGLGIGLSLADGLVRLHGGTVEAHSEGSNAGSEFIVRLSRPATASEADDGGTAGQIQPASPAQDAAVRRILVVDDNVDGANTTAELLRILGNEVAVAHDGLAAVQMAADFEPELILLDLGLPGIDGYEAARRIRAAERERRIRIIALTGWGGDKDKRQTVEAGFDDHWVKPVEFERLQGI